MLKALNTPKIDVLILLAIVSIMLLGSLTIWSASGYSEAP
ncbi:hypothetical protein JCM19239_3423 [Vibrio variabilis]|uniref:Uncharacterized protein n=1 Tax=Vibrio variabilis TaxID=990271 RepID=A0ABQ0JGU9_9VIBR|nr:hypothetical protein JCM19239_3423 [Vibrio variabilis]